MRPLTLDDLMPLEEFVARRAELFAQHARYLDRYRRVRVGPKLTLIFENRQTLWFRVQEIVRVARLADPLRLQHELDVYNRLLPGRGRLAAALLLDVPEGPDWAERIGFWRDLSGASIRLTAGQGATGATLVTTRPEDRGVGSAHWIEFDVPDAVRGGLSDGRRECRVAVEHRTYHHASAPLGEAARQSLLDDLTLSDRDARAA